MLESSDQAVLRKDEAFKTSLYLLRDARLLTAILINRFLDNLEEVLIKLEKYVQSEFGV